jgi:hypothetical protein
MNTQKKAYATPQLTKHGSVTQITLGRGGDVGIGRGGAYH